MKVLTENFLAVGFSPASFFDFLADLPCWCDDRSTGTVTWTHIHALFGNPVLLEIVLAHSLHPYCNFGPIDGVNVT